MLRAVIESPEDLGRLVRRIRQEFGLTQRELAEELETSQRYIYELEVGKPKRADAAYFRLLSRMGIHLYAVVETAPE